MKKARRHRDTVSDSELEPQGINEKNSKADQISACASKFWWFFTFEKKNEHSTKLA